MSSIRSWNNIGVEYSSSNSISIFKTRILNLVRPSEKSVFEIHSPTGLKYIFQLRLGLSPLKCHKRHHNFTDTPTDWCDCRCAPEDTAHFLVSCHLHNVHRARLHDSVLEILVPYDMQNFINNTDLYLYGHSSLSQSENKKILLSTIKFINESNRFA